ncbi:MAG: hypothetical protein E6G04_01500 [Actinobacteria bacterium]|nr:MAG: hypothetical protein E6G04_01500 [Actinomycetota bacterium]
MTRARRWNRRGVLLAFICGISSIALGGSAVAATRSVSMQNIAYNPTSVTIHVGDKVTWTNNETGLYAPQHTATSDDGHTFDSGFLNPGQSYSFTFTKAGKFAFHCNVHSNMHGTVTVIGSTPSSSPSPTPTHTRPKPTATATAKPVVVPASPTPTSSVKPSPRASKTQRPSATPKAHVTPSASAGRVAAAVGSSSSKGSGAVYVWAAAALVVVAAAGALLLRARKTHR